MESKIMKNKHYSENKKCIDCYKTITNLAIRCWKCEAIRKVTLKLVDNSGKHNGQYKNGFYCCNKKCIDCGKHCSSGAIRCKSCNEHLNKLGKKNPQYIHGRGHLPYTKDFPKIRINILKRDNYICQLCEKKGNTVHHIDYNQINNKKNNLITLCLKCNLKVNNNRDYWYIYFTYLMEG
jgi:hypothetical protein